MDRIPATGTCGTGRPASLGPGSRQAGTRIEAENATRCTIDRSVGRAEGVERLTAGVRLLLVPLSGSGTTLRESLAFLLPQT